MQDLEALIARLPGDEAKLRRSGEATRQGAVLPVLEALGWDHRNLSEVEPRVAVRGGRVSYGLKAGGRTLAFVEARRAGDDPAKGRQRFVEAAAGEGVPLAALTDGLAWRLYLAAEAADAERRLVCAVDFRSDPPARAAAGIRRFIGRDAVVGGKALEAAERESERRERDRAALARVWRRLVTEPTGTYGDTLHDLLAEAVEVEAGHRPDREAVHRFLLGESAAPPRIAENGHPSPGMLDTSDPAIFKGLRPAAFWLDGSRHEIRSWRWLLPRMCDLLARGAPSEFVQRTERLGGQLRLRPSAPTPDWIRIRGTGRYVNVNITADKIVGRARRVLIAVRGQQAADSFTIECTQEQRRPARRIKGFRLDGVHYDVSTWKGMLLRVCELAAEEAGERFAELVSPLRGRSAYFDRSPGNLREPRALRNGLFVETMLNSEQCERRAREVLIAVRGPRGAEGFTIEPAGPRRRRSRGRRGTARTDYMGKRPVAFLLDGVRHEVANWRAVLAGTCELLAREAGAEFGQRVADIRGRNRPYFSEDPNPLLQPLPLANSGFFVESKFSAPATVRLARRVIEAVRGPHGADSFTIELAE